MPITDLVSHESKMDGDSVPPRAQAHRPQHDPALPDYGEIEEEDDDDDDSYDSSSNFSSVSQDSLPPIKAHGHTYHGSGRILMPNDASEARRLYLLHKLFTLCLDGKLVDAKLPLENHSPENKFHILDVGAGSGIWACEMAQRHPEVDILGVDITSALLPKDVPPNVTFEIADTTDPWPPTLYDFIHMRNLAGGGIRDWPALLRNAYNHLKPGGQLEFTEIRPRFFDVDPEAADMPDLNEGERPEIGAACLEYERVYTRLCQTVGVDLDPIPGVAGCLSDLGAQSIRERVDWLPVKVWGNDAVMRRKGEILAEAIGAGLENVALRLFGLGGWTDKETRDLLARVKKETQDPRLRSLVLVTFITARKPVDNGGNLQRIW